MNLSEVTSVDLLEKYINSLGLKIKLTKTEDNTLEFIFKLQDGTSIGNACDGVEENLRQTILDSGSAMRYIGDKLVLMYNKSGEGRYSITEVGIVINVSKLDYDDGLRIIESGDLLIFGEGGYNERYNGDT